MPWSPSTRIVVAVQRLAGDAGGLDDQRDRQRPGDDGGVAADRALLEHHAALSRGRSRAARRGRCCGPRGSRPRAARGRCGAVAGEQPQQPVRQVVEVVQPLAQVGVGGCATCACGWRTAPSPPRPRRRGRASIEASMPADPALVVGEHAVGVQHVAVLARCGEMVGGEHLVYLRAQRLDRRRAAARVSRSGSSLIGSETTICGSCEHDVPSATPSWPTRPRDEERPLVRPRAGHRAGADEGAELGHLGDDHGDHLEGVDLVVGVFPRLAVLHHQHAQHLAQPLDRHAEEAREDLLAGLGQVAEAAGMRRVAGVDRLGASRRCGRRGPGRPAAG